MVALKRLIMLSTLLLATAGLTSGCGLGEKAVEKAIEQATGVAVDQKDNAITVTTSEGQVQIGGESKKLPDDFPLPAYADAKIVSSMTTSENGAKHFIVSMSSTKPIKDLAAYYESALKEKGIQPERTEINDQNSNTVFLNGKSGKLEASVQIFKGDSIGEEGHVINLIVKVSP